MPRGVWTDYGADWSVLLPVLQSVILHCCALGYCGQDHCFALCLVGWLSCALWTFWRRTDPVVGAFLSCLEFLSLDVLGPFNAVHRKYQKLKIG